MSINAEVRPPIPPFTLESAIEKVRLAEDAGNWFRSYGNENWESGPDGLTHHRYACINDMPIKASDHKFHSPLGRRPDDHPGLSELGL